MYISFKYIFGILFPINNNKGLKKDPALLFMMIMPIFVYQLTGKLSSLDHFLTFRIRGLREEIGIKERDINLLA
ncbi:unnamed protein product [Rhizophagus irregularis]|nr:unnamed protein product [Rhizophagus irregularis]